MLYYILIKEWEVGRTSLLLRILLRIYSVLHPPMLCESQSIKCLRVKVWCISNIW